MSKTPRISIGIVVRDESLAERARNSIIKAGMTTVFDEPLSSLSEGQLPKKADAVLFAGLIDSRGDVEFERIREAAPEVPFIAFSSDDNDSTLRFALQMGVEGLVSLGKVENTLATTVQGVVAGLLVVPRGSRRHMPVRDLTNREKQVLSLVIMGLTNREISEKLFISETTVKSHLNTSYRKLGIHSRAEAVRIIADPERGLGTGILAITGPGLARGRHGKS